MTRIGVTILRLLFIALAVLAASKAYGQTLPHNVPDLCALDPTCTVVPAGTSPLISGTHTTIKVLGSATVTGQLRVQTILCYPGASLTFADGSETIISDAPINTQVDPEQWGHGIVGECQVRAQGRTVQSHVRLLVEPLAGAATLTLQAAPTGWQAGDRIIVPDTRQLPDTQWYSGSAVLQHEVRRIAGISGTVITIDVPLAFAHKGARNADGTTTALLPHVGNLTRSIIIRSENPQGTRGHVAFVGRANVDLRGVAFVGLGRTTTSGLHSTSGVIIGANQIGRYPVHFHHVWGPVNPTNAGYQFVFEGNSIEDSLKWPLAIHGSHFGLVRNNVIFGGGNLNGAGIALEDGSETENLIDSNFVVDIRGNVNPRQTGPNTGNGTTPGSAADCIWGAGFNNRFVNNVLTGCRNTFQSVASGTGFKLIVQSIPPPTKNPRFRGADMGDPTQTVSVNPQQQPILEMRGNEVYGLAATGATFWQLGTNGIVIGPCATSLIQDFAVWHTYDGALWLYPTCGLTVRNLTVRLDGSTAAWWSVPAAIAASDYPVANLTVQGASIHSGAVFEYVTNPYGAITFDNVNAVTRFHAYQLRTPQVGASGSQRTNVSVTVRVNGGAVTPWPGQTLKTISMTHTGGDSLNPYSVLVSNYQGSAQAFQVFYPIQTTTAQYYGGQAPCSDTTTHPEIAGVTCTANVPPPPPPPQEICGNGIDDDGDGLIDEGCTPPPPPPPDPVDVALQALDTAIAALVAAVLALRKALGK